MSKKTTPNLYDLAQNIKNKYFVKEFNNQIWYRTNYKWFNDFLNPIKKIITMEYGSWLNDNFNQINQIQQYLQNSVENEPKPSNDKPQVYFQNGYLDIEKGFVKYKDDDKDVIFNPFVLPFDYKEIKENELVERFLNTLFSEKKDFHQPRYEIIEFVKAFCYTCFSGFCPKEFLVLFGSGDNGKSLFVRFLTQIAGYLNTGTFTNQSFNTKFGLSQIYLKTFGVNEDASNDCLNDKFKLATGGGTIPIEAKGKDNFTDTLNASLILCSNNQIRYKDKSLGFESRLCEIELFRNFKTTDYKLRFNDKEVYKLLHDVNGFNYFITQCFKSFKSLYDNKGNIKIPLEVKQISDEIYKDNNIIYTWLTQSDVLETEFKPDGKWFVNTNTIYQLFVDWYKEYFKVDRFTSKYSPDGVFRDFKKTMELKFSNLYDFDFSLENKTSICLNYQEQKFEKGYWIIPKDFNKFNDQDDYLSYQNQLVITKKSLEKQLDIINQKCKELDKVIKNKFYKKELNNYAKQ